MIQIILASIPKKTLEAKKAFESREVEASMKETSTLIGAISAANEMQLSSLEIFHAYSKMGIVRTWQTM